MIEALIVECCMGKTHGNCLVFNLVCTLGFSKQTILRSNKHVLLWEVLVLPS